jgi:hypothetical protein
MGHREVKAAVAERLIDLLPGYLPDPVWVGIADFMPADESRWPFAIVRTSRMTGSRNTGGGQLRCRYRVEVAVGVRAPIADADEARAATTDTRDDLLTAARNALLWRRMLTTDIRIPTGQHLEETRPSVQPASGSAWIALGTLTIDVATIEEVPRPSTVPAPAVITTAEVDVDMHPLDTQQIS